MPRKKDEEEDDPLRRRQRKAHAAAARDMPGGTMEKAQRPVAQQEEVKKLAHDRLDYSRFKGIVEASKEERLRSGAADWSDLNEEQRKAVAEQTARYEEILERKRQEEDEWRRQLREKPSDLSWVQGRHFATYEAFCVGRVEATFKKSGNEHFRAGKMEEAAADWEAGVQMLLALGQLTPDVLDLLGVLRNNLAQVHVKRCEWNKVKELTDKVLDHDKTNEKALYRRAQAFIAMSLWQQAYKDLEALLQHHPANKVAMSTLEMVKSKLGKDKRSLAGRAVSDIAPGLMELSADGTVRKLRIEEYGEGDPDAAPDWLKDEWLQKGASERAVVTCQLVVWSHGGEELYNSKEYRPFPETKQSRDELKEYMEMVNFLDQEAGKKPRLVGDFYRKVKKRPVRWYLGDPGMYRGLDLAARTMKPGERALFEVDQPSLSPSVDSYYAKLGFHSGLAGLPQLVYHIEEERLAILEDEVPEEELDLANKAQRGVRVELHMLGYVIYKDVSSAQDGSRLHGVLHPGLADAEPVVQGQLVRGAFFITRPFDGSLLVQNQYCEWRLGADEGLYEKEGENKEPLRPDGGPFVPRCVADALLKVQWQELRLGCLVEVRTQVGPELHEICPQYAKQFEQARRDNHRKGKKGGAPCSILVQLFPPEFFDNQEEAPFPSATEAMAEPDDLDIE
mmetsp:Transcript_29069/g.66863  ORF Transcript_29069/g.66863 Transcript_29069/m.66863 type:complete len:677 (-) Transcript_29069:30-2060(-)